MERISTVQDEILSFFQIIQIFIFCRTTVSGKTVIFFRLSKGSAINSNSYVFLITGSFYSSFYFEIA